MGHSWRDTSLFVKVLLAVQTAIIVGLSVWMYNEYVSNSYLQTYLGSRLQGMGSIIAVMSLGGLVATVLVGILLRRGIFLETLITSQRGSRNRLMSPKPVQRRQ